MKYYGQSLILHFMIWCHLPYCNAGFCDPNPKGALTHLFRVVGRGQTCHLSSFARNPIFVMFSLNSRRQEAGTDASWFCASRKALLSGSEQGTIWRLQELVQSKFIFATSHISQKWVQGGKLCSLSQGLGNHSKFVENAETLKPWFSTCALRSYGGGQLTLSRELHIRYLYFIIYIS